MSRLIIDTSSKLVYVAYNGELLISTQEMKHLESLPNMVSSLVTKITEIKEIYVGVGPGSYTGLRVGTLFAQALAKSLGVKCLGVDSQRLLSKVNQEQGITYYSDSLNVIPKESIKTEAKQIYGEDYLT